MGGTPKGGEGKAKAAQDAALRVRQAFEEGRDPREVVTAEECELCAELERRARTVPDITPGIPDTEQRRALDAWKNNECAKAVILAAI